MTPATLHRHPDRPPRSNGRPWIATVPRYAMTIAYDGSEFHGWQRQDVPVDSPLAAGADPMLASPLPGRVAMRTVQAVVERAVRSIVREDVVLMGSSRTDAGVHARGQVGAFTTTEPERGRGWPPERGLEPLRRALNDRLPPDVLISSVALVPPHFDPIGHAVRKQYTYRILDGGDRPLWDRATTTHLFHRLDPGPMRDAAQALVGTHDFAALASPQHGRLTTVRTIHRCDVERTPEGRVAITVEGNGFLYHMVRIIAGTLCEVGRGKQPSAWVADVLASRDRMRAGPTMPPQGLCLDWIQHQVPPASAPVECEPASELTDPDG